MAGRSAGTKLLNQDDLMWCCHVACFSHGSGQFHTVQCANSCTTGSTAHMLLVSSLLEEVDNAAHVFKAAMSWFALQVCVLHR
jgi:hypothetical protein